MKFFSIIFLFFISISCKNKISEPLDVCLSTNPKWNMTKFNSDYQLGFPDEYLEGTTILGKSESEYLFFKNRKKSDVIFQSGFFVNNAIYSHYPNILLRTLPDSVEVMDFKTKYLKNKITLCSQGNIIGVFYWGQLYYEKNAPLKTPRYQEEFGDLYLKIPNQNSFQLSARFDYMKIYHDEVFEILSTLTPIK
jgi:hypothetical protein